MKYDVYESESEEEEVVKKYICSNEERKEICGNEIIKKR